MQNNIFTFSDHAKKRAAQRGISTQMILEGIEWGEEIYKQGLMFITVTKKNFERSRNFISSEKIHGLTLVISEQNVILTCYKNKRAFKAIKRKSKRLAKYAYHSQMTDVA